MALVQFRFSDSSLFPGESEEMKAPAAIAVHIYDPSKQMERPGQPRRDSEGRCRKGQQHFLGVNADLLRVFIRSLPAVLFPADKKVFLFSRTNSKLLSEAFKQK